MSRKIIHASNAPRAIGTYSQAVEVDGTVYISGQIPLCPDSMEMREGDISARIRQVFANLAAVAEAAGGNLQDIVKLNIYLTDMENFALVNKLMEEYFSEPFPARAAVGVASLPRQAEVEIDAIMRIC